MIIYFFFFFSFFFFFFFFLFVVFFFFVFFFNFYRRMDFRAQCDNAFISALALSHSLFIDNIAFRSELRDRFNGFIPALSGVSAISLLVR